MWIVTSTLLDTFLPSALINTHIFEVRTSISGQRQRQDLVLDAAGFSEKSCVRSRGHIVVSRAMTRQQIMAIGFVVISGSYASFYDLSCPDLSSNRLL